MSELQARVNAVIRRKNFAGKNENALENMIIDLEGKTVRVDEHVLVLTRKEYEILLFFISNKNRVVSKSSLAEHIWGDPMDQADSYDFIYSQIKNLRKKLKGFNSVYNIAAVYGLGYKLIAS